MQTLNVLLTIIEDKLSTIKKNNHQMQTEIGVIREHVDKVDHKTQEGYWRNVNLIGKIF